MFCLLVCRQHLVLVRVSDIAQSWKNSMHLLRVIVWLPRWIHGSSCSLTLLRCGRTCSNDLDGPLYIPRIPAGPISDDFNTICHHILHLGLRLHSAWCISEVV